MVLVIKDDQITIEKIAKRKTNIEEAYTYFPETECRYIIWDVEDNSVNSKRPVSKVSIWENVNHHFFVTNAVYMSYIMFVKWLNN